MLVQFTVGNYLSFKEDCTFSMLGDTPIKEHEGEASNYNVAIAPSNKIKLLKTAVLYGANGSGKSNLLQAMHFFKEFVLTSSNARQATDAIEVIPFLLSTETEKAPSFFEIIFYVENIRYRYGFEVTQEVVETEWLFSMNSTPSAKEKKLFTREFQEITCNARSFKEGKGLENNTRPNALFLSVVAQLNGEIATGILTWLAEQFIYLSGLEQGNQATVTKELQCSW